MRKLGGRICEFQFQLGCWDDLGKQFFPSVLDTLHSADLNTLCALGFLSKKVEFNTSKYLKECQ